jgi:REP element-mobilizing transposase RayT
MPNKHIPLLPDHQYHILGRAIGSEKLFAEEQNYPFFLSRYKNHVRPVADTYAYCLLPNHFHMAVRIKDEITLAEQFEFIKNKNSKITLLSDFVMERFSNFLNSYTKSFNKVYHRKGSLLIDYLRRIEIADSRQFMNTLLYIHQNPVHHGYCKKITQWPWSSYTTLLSDKRTNLLRTEVIECFGGIDNFIDFHKRPLLKKTFS